jgi:hypothetical protein
MADESTLTYRSAIDLLHPLLALALLLQGGLMLWVYDPLPPPLHNYAGWLFIGFGVLAVLAILTTSYRITDSNLVVRSFLFRLRIPLKGIEKIADRRCFPVRFGCSRDAVEVKYRSNGMTGSVMISPKDKDTFLWDLTEAIAGAAVPDKTPVTES